MNDREVDDFSLWVDDQWEEQKEEYGVSTNSELAHAMLDELAEEASEVQEGEIVPAAKAEPVKIQEGKAKMSKDDIVYEISESFSQFAEIITFLNESSKPLIYTKRSITGNTMPYYRFLSRKEAESMVHNFIKNRGDLHHLAVPAVSKTVNAVVDTIEQATLKPGASRTNGLIYIGNDAYGAPLYFDTYENELKVGEGEIDRPCFFHLCDTPYPLSGVPKIDFESLDTNTIIKFADQAEADMKAYRENKVAYPVRFESTFGLWADGNADLYVDLLTVSALPLFANKPPKIFFPLGVAANGKSGWRHLLQTIYGTENTASVSTKQMGDWSYTSTLDGKLLNFPDEDDVQAALDTPFFKSIASHDTVNFAKKGSSEPLRIKCDFVSIIPMNREPEWSNMDGGIMRRICILPFTHDFSSEDKNVSASFEETTFTTELISQLIGEFIGIARYYSHNDTPLTFSDMTARTNDEFMEVHDNVTIFKRKFESYFYGFSSMQFLYDNYSVWCKANDVPPVDKGRFKLYFKDYAEIKRTRVSNRSMRLYCRASYQPSLYALSQYTMIPYQVSPAPGCVYTKPIEDLLNMNIDPITALEYIKEEKSEWMKKG